MPLVGPQAIARIVLFGLGYQEWLNTGGGTEHFFLLQLLMYAAQVQVAREPTIFSAFEVGVLSHASSIVQIPTTYYPHRLIIVKSTLE